MKGFHSPGSPAEAWAAGLTSEGSLGDNLSHAGRALVAWRRRLKRFGDSSLHRKHASHWIVLFVPVLGAAPAMSADEKPKAVPPRPPMIRWEKKKLADNLCEACEIADVNKDGKLDVISGPAWYEAPEWKPHPIREMKPMGPNNEFMQTNG